MRPRRGSWSCGAHVRMGSCPKPARAQLDVLARSQMLPFRLSSWGGTGPLANPGRAARVARPARVDPAALRGPRPAADGSGVDAGRLLRDSGQLVRVARSIGPDG